MEIVTIQLIVQGVGLVSDLKTLTGNKSMLSKMSKGNLDSVFWRFRYLYGILMPSGTGKTQLVKNLYGKDYLLVDVDALTIGSYRNDEERNHVEGFKQRGELSTYMALTFGRAKEIIHKLADDFGTKKLVLVTSSKELADYLNIREGNRITLCPSSSLVDTLVRDKTPAESEAFKASVASYKIAVSDYVCFESFESLHSKICKFFGKSLKIRV